MTEDLYELDRRNKDVIHPIDKIRREALETVKEEQLSNCCDNGIRYLLKHDGAWWAYADTVDVALRGRAEQVDSPILFCPWCGSRLPLEEKRFPIQRVGTIPWYEAEIAYKTYREIFHNDQTLEVLAKRGGFGLAEFCCLYMGKNPIRTNRESTELSIFFVTKKLTGRWIIKDGKDARTRSS